MLILTRRSGESISIGDDVVLTVLEVSGDHIRLGIQAPRDVVVLRRELKEAVEQENRQAASCRGRLPRRIASVGDKAEPEGHDGSSPPGEPVLAAS